MKSLTYFIVLILLVSFPAFGQKFNPYSDLETENSDIYMSGNPYQKDILLFYNMLENTHPYYANRHKSRELEKESMKAYLWAKECTTTSQFGAFIQKRLTIIEDGHTTVVPTYKTNLIYPVNLYCIDDSEVYVKGITSKYKEFLGKRLKFINGSNVKDVLDCFRKNICSDNVNYFIENVSNVMQFFQNWENVPYVTADSSLNLVFSDSTSINIRPSNIKEEEIVWAFDKERKGLTAPKKALFYYEILEDSQICYLQFNAFIDRNTEIQRITTTMPVEQELPKNVLAKLEKLPRFDLFIENMFHDIKAKDVKTLVIDLRNNKGGNSILGDILLSWLKPLSQTNEYRSYTRLSPLFEIQYPSLIARYKKAAQDNGISINAKELYSGKYLTSMLGSQESHKNLFLFNTTEWTFSGNVIFIQGRSTYSSAGMLLTKAKDNGVGLIIGDESSYSPDTYGDMLMWILPNTGIKGYISSKYFHSPAGGKRQRKVLVPDVLISQSWNDFIAGSDPAWNWIENKKYKVK